MQEKEDVAVNRKHCKEILQVLQQAAWVWRTLLNPLLSQSSSCMTFLVLLLTILLHGSAIFRNLSQKMLGFQIARIQTMGSAAT
jgi:hypothetical protein